MFSRRLLLFALALCSFEASAKEVPVHVTSVDSAIVDELAAMLRDRAEVDVEGFGQIIVQEYQAYDGRDPKTGQVVRVPEKKLPAVRFDKGLKRYISGEQAQPPSVRAPALCERVAARTGRRPADVEPLVAGLFDTAFHKLKETKRSQRIGELGHLVARAKGRAAEGRLVLTFSPSLAWKAALNGPSQLDAIRAQEVELILSAYPADGLRDVNTLDAALARMGARTAAIAGPERPWHPLIRALASHSDGVRDALRLDPIVSIGAWNDAIARRDQRLKGKSDAKPLIPFATYDTSMWLLRSEASGGQPTVLELDPDGIMDVEDALGAPVPLSEWLTERLLRAEIERALAGRRLSGESLDKLNAYLDRAAPHAGRATDWQLF